MLLPLLLPCPRLFTPTAVPQAVHTCYCHAPGCPHLLLPYPRLSTLFFLLLPRYHGSREAAQQELPFDSGFESVNVVAAVGPGVPAGEGLWAQACLQVRGCGLRRSCR